MVPPCSDRISRVPPYSRTSPVLPVRGYHPLWPAFPDASGYLSEATGLVRVRSPLLTESRLMSFPPGTEMFQFPGFASCSYGFRTRSPCGGVAPFGYLRIKVCSRLPEAFRSVPRPSSPLSAKASTKCPSKRLSPTTRNDKTTLRRVKHVSDCGSHRCSRFFFNSASFSSNNPPPERPDLQSRRFYAPNPDPTSE